MIYFDNATTSYPKPNQVIKAVTESLNTMGSGNRGFHGLSQNANHMIYDTRRKVSEMFAVSSPLRVIFTLNATESLNIAISGTINQEDHVITTAFEHNSVLRPLYKTGCQLSVVAFKDDYTIDYTLLESLIRKNTKAIVATHASNVTGDIINIGIIGKICEKYGLLFIVDASQTAAICDINMKRDNIDVLCFSGHKGFFAPQGVGCLCLGENTCIPPYNVGGSGSNSFEKEHPKTMPDALEAGTLNAHGIAGFSAGIDYVTDIGKPLLRKKTSDLTEHFYENIKGINGLKIYGNFSDQPLPIIALNLYGYDSVDICEMLYDDFSIATRGGVHCAPLLHKALNTEKQGMVRFSFSYMNTLDEINAGITALETLSKRL